MAESILMSDPPIHTGYRKPLAEQLSVAALAPDASAIMSVAVTLVEQPTRGRASTPRFTR